MKLKQKKWAESREAAWLILKRENNSRKEVGLGGKGLRKDKICGNRTGRREKGQPKKPRSKAGGAGVSETVQAGRKRGVKRGGEGNKQN